MSQAQTPYSPPLAPVRDPVEPDLPKPAAISRAAICLGISAAVVVVTTGITLANWVKSAPLLTAMHIVVISAFSIGLLALIAWKLNAGRGWARWFFLVLYVLGTVVFVAGLFAPEPDFPSAPIHEQVSAAVQFGLQTAALIFMFTPAAGRWLQSRSGK